MALTPSSIPIATAANRGVTLTVHELAAGGEAVGRLTDGRVVFVPGGAAEEEVEVRLTTAHRSYARGELLRVVTPSPARVVPPCALASALPPDSWRARPGGAPCGGCPLMHVARPAQLGAKQEWVRRAVRHSGAEVLPLLAPTPPLGYRVRARLTVRDGRLSFASARSHRGAAPSRCPVLEPRLEAVLLGAGPAVAPALGEGGALLGLVGQLHGAPAVHLAAQLAPGGRAAVVRAWLQELLAAGQIVGATLSGDTIATATFGAPAVDLGEHLPDAAVPGSLWASAEGFAQASAAGHRELPRVVAELVGLPPTGGRWPHLIELYAGSGNLTRALRPLTEHLVAIEGDAGAIARLRRQLAATPPDHAQVEVLHQPVERAVLTLLAQGARFDVAVLDPPRSGARPALAALGQLGVRRVVYVSCDAMTLGRDLVELRAAGLRPRRVQPIDLMPHTAQVECIALLDVE